MIASPVPSDPKPRAQRHAIPPPLADDRIADTEQIATADTAVHMPRKPVRVPIAIVGVVVAACVAVLVVVLLTMR